jgi:hypothetical protein
MQVQVLMKPGFVRPKWGLWLHGSVKFSFIEEVQLGGGLMISGNDYGDLGVLLLNGDGIAVNFPVCFVHGMCGSGEACIAGRCVVRFVLSPSICRNFFLETRPSKEAILKLRQCICVY